MRSLRTLLLLGGAAAAAVVLFLVLRPDDDASPTAATTRTTPQAPAPAGTPSPDAPPRPRTSATRVRIVVRDGRPVGGVRRVVVPEGGRVVLVVHADVRDEVHVHGYDRLRDVRPGRPAHVVLRATVPGRFEVELEERHRQIAVLEVRP